MKKSIFILFILGAVHFVVNAQTDSIKQKLDEYLTAANKLNKFNGNVLIAQKGKSLLQKSYGYKNLNALVLNDSNTIFQIGSVTKQFTATVVLKLQEEGKLSVHDKLDTYFPQFTHANEITLENLLTHTSGIYDYVIDIDEEDSAITCNPVDKQLILDLIFQHDLNFKPGTQFQYCNSGYYLLGLIIEKVTGKSYEQNVRDIIFTPLQMTHSLFDFKHSPDTNIATGYQTLNDSVQKEASAWRWDSTVSYAAGAIWSTTEDMYKWTQAVARKKILSADSWKAVFTPHLDHYGYGWYIDSLFDKKAISHGGGIPGFIAYLCYYPEEDVAIILLNNYGWFGEALNSINADLSAIIFHKPYKLLKNRENKTFAEAILKKYVGKYQFDKKHHAYISLENGQLQMEAPEGGLPKSPLFAQDETNFYLKVIDARIEFVKDASGNITELIAYYNGKAEVCKKVNN
ncbi:MAG TPA: serine hydrolase [Parafilimonas sp.]|nr:serine hydrolase [Parafilimonas sp.]